MRGIGQSERLTSEDDFAAAEQADAFKLRL